MEKGTEAIRTKLNGGENMRSKTALLIIDMINPFDFEGGEQLLVHTKSMLPSLLKLKEQAKKLQLPILYINDHYYLRQNNIDELIEIGKQGKGATIIEQIIPEKEDFVLLKSKHSAFFGTQLRTQLTEQGIQNLIITGIAGDMCILFTAIDAYMRNYSLWVPSNCIASETQERKNLAIDLMHSSLSISTTSSKQLTIQNAFS